MKSGFSKICINPVYGMPVRGYYEKRYVKGILDDLFIRTVVFDDDSKCVAIISLDLGNLPQNVFDAMREEIAKFCNMDKEAVFISCIHTHTGPNVVMDENDKDSIDFSYAKMLIAQVRDSVIYAKADLNETEVEYAQSRVENVAFERRYRMKDGSVSTNPGVNNPEIAHPLGSADDTVKLVKLKRKTADDILIINFACHPDTIGGEYISADFPGFAISYLEEAVPGTKCMFLQGAEGDINHINVNPTSAENKLLKPDFDGVPRGIRYTAHIGKKIAGAVLSVTDTTEKIDCQSIDKYTVELVKLPSFRENHRINEATRIVELYDSGRGAELEFKEMELTTAVAEAKRILSLENGPDFFTFNISGIKIGDLVFAGIGGEAFAEIGGRICDLCPDKKSIVCCLTNGQGGYIPTTRAYSEGGYEARCSKLSAGGDDIIVETVKNFLEK
ncbi:MAG: neutral/alkaline non-lysosomal ceramidase N-terminal domain-containing protein [Clostridia bacterium]|nr:neutral/alkaline non-lysosomal ceramidase N-terminal domain-containing protein [Clostridia bacterium]